MKEHESTKKSTQILTRTPIPRVTPVTPPTPTPIPSPTPTVYEAACDNPTLGSKIWDGTQWDCEYYRDNQEAMKTERHPSPWYYWQLLCDDVPYEQYVRNHCAGAAKAAKIPAPTHYTHWDHLCNNTNPGIDTAKLPLEARPESQLTGFRTTPNRRITVAYGGIMYGSRCCNPSSQRKSAQEKSRFRENRGSRPDF